MDVFWTNGYEASSTQELCERTGLGRGSLYHAFGSKQNLYEQALRRYQELGLRHRRTSSRALEPPRNDCGRCCNGAWMATLIRPSVAVAWPCSRSWNAVAKTQ
ncbi:TetR/AcrR family transcriptional regulator [Serratia ureilytica]